MLTKALVLISLAVFATAAPEQKRQIQTCTNAFTLTSNPCSTGQGRTYYSVPGDNTKFVQCDILGGAYVVQCPTGQFYNPTRNSCQLPQAQVTAAPQTNPCTIGATSAGAIYFTFPGDQTKFYQCTGLGQLQVAQCPTNLIWSQSRVSCVLPAGTNVTPTRIPVLQPANTGFNNPCTSQQLSAHNMYFTHPDPHKFIQCDLVGNAYAMDCPTNLIWNQYYEVCTSSFNLNGQIGRK